MNIDTTINITNTNKTLVNQVAEKLNISRSGLIIQLLKKYMHENKNTLIQHKSVSYQQKKKCEKWKKIHVWLDENFYEKCLDLRKFHKLSLSKIIQIAIALYLDNIINEITDNYQDYYSCMCKIINNSPVFIITWQQPDKKTAKHNETIT